MTADEEDSENGVSYEKIEARNAEGKEVWVRHVKKVTGLYDVTIAGHPAYEQTSVGTREVDEFLDTKIGEPAEILKQREAEAKRKAEEEAQRKREQEEREAEERERIRIDMQRRERVLRANEMMLEDMTL
jgi:phage head maturation protease